MLIKTKLQAPLLRSGMLFRKTLIEQLSAARGHPLILITGPAGSGKTSLACQWIKKEQFSVAWYSLDEEDNEPELFFRYLLTAIAQTNNELNEALSPLIVNPQQLEAQNVIACIVEYLFSIDQRIYLILDDFHQIRTDEIHNAVARLIQYLPPCLHVIILSRHGLSATIDAVAAKKEKLEISGSNLKFTETETATFFEKVTALPFSLNQIQKLYQHVEGWAAGLQLVGLSANSKQLIDVSLILDKTREQVANYLIHDILRLQTEKIRTFVFTTALLDRFNPVLCTQVTGYRDTAKILLHLEHINLFLIPLDSEEKWYRYHQMFAQVVRQMVAVEAPDLPPTTLRKAALWFADNGHIEDAMRSAFESEDFEFTADLMESHINKYNEKLDHKAGLRWILRLPLKVLNQRLLLLLHQCHFLFILMELSDFKEILALIDRQKDNALLRYTGIKRTLCEDFIIYLKCMQLILHAETSEDIVTIKMQSKKIFHQNLNFSIAIEILSLHALISKGDLAQAKAVFDKIAGLIASFTALGTSIYFAKARNLIARYQGRLHQAETIITKVLQELDRPKLARASIAFLLHRHLGHIYYLQNRLDKAQECAAMAVRYCEEAGLLDEVMTGNELVLLLNIATGKKEAAVQCIKKIRNFAAKLDMPEAFASADASAARIAIEQGNLATAVIWSNRRGLKIDEPFSLLYAMECLTQARLFYAREKYSDATDLLKVLRKRCIKRNLLELVLEIDILNAAVVNAMDLHNQALAILRQALAFAEHEGYVRPFVNYSELIAPVLSRIANDLPEASHTLFFRQVFTACNISPVRPQPSSKAENLSYGDLTQREVEILEWMAKGSKNKEIAQNAFISLNTVKTHVRRIMAKLGANTRTQAILKAKEFGIIHLD